MSPRLPHVTAETADDKQRTLLDDTKRQLGRVPNLYASMANGPRRCRGTWRCVTHSPREC